MKKLLLTSLGTLALVLPNAPAQSLFTTSNDFVASASSQFMVAPTSAVDLDGATINGLGNTNAAGLPGTPGSASLTWVSGSFDYVFFSPGEQGNAPFLAALEGASALTFDFTTPPAGTGNYFQLGLVVNYQGGFDQLFPASTINLGGGVTQATISFASEAGTIAAAQAGNGGSFSYFELGVIYNSNFNTSTAFNIDNFQAVPVPEPSVMALFSLGALGLSGFARRRFRS